MRKSLQYHLERIEEAKNKGLESIARNPAKMVEWLIEKGALSRGAFIVDLGCGGGIEVAYLKKKGYNACGIDSNTNVIKVIRELENIVGLEIPVICAFAEHLPFTNESIDAIYHIGLLHNQPKSKKKEIMKEIKRVLKKDGFIVFGEFVKENLGKEVDYNGKPQYPFEDVGEIEKIYKDCGFEIISIKVRSTEDKKYICEGIAKKVR